MGVKRMWGLELKRGQPWVYYGNSDQILKAKKQHTQHCRKFKSKIGGLGIICPIHLHTNTFNGAWKIILKIE